MLKVRTSVMNEPSTRITPPRSDGHGVRFEMRRNHPQVLDGLMCTRKAVSLVQAIEVVWHDLKAHHLAHQTFTDIAALDQAIHTAVEDLNGERIVGPSPRRDGLGTTHSATGKADHAAFASLITTKSCTPAIASTTAITSKNSPHTL
jgi:hypothetical protein